MLMTNIMNVSELLFLSVQTFCFQKMHKEECCSLMRGKHAQVFWYIYKSKHATYPGPEKAKVLLELLKISKSYIQPSYPETCWVQSKVQRQRGRAQNPSTKHPGHCSTPLSLSNYTATGGTKPGLQIPLHTHNNHHHNHLSTTSTLDITLWFCVTNRLHGWSFSRKWVWSSILRQTEKQEQIQKPPWGLQGEQVTGWTSLLLCVLGINTYCRLLQLRVWSFNSVCRDRATASECLKSAKRLWDLH